MKVLHINTSDIIGGAAIAGYRLHQGLLAKGVDSRLLVGSSSSNQNFAATIPRKQRLENFICQFTKKSGFNDFHCVSSFDIPNHTFYQNADIINFHNLHGGYFSYLSLPLLTKNKPAVITLHDMWSFTGHCIYSYDCNRWETGCGYCPYPESYPSIKNDATHLEWQIKRNTYLKSNLVVVTLSSWLTKLAQKSILSCLPIHHIPNGIDTSIYQPLDKKQCKYLLNIPEGKKVLMFAVQSLSDARKGGDLLLNALQRLPNSLKSNIVLLTFGGGNIKISSSLEMEIFDLGYISNDRLKSIAYSAADLFVFPTRADNLPLVLQESMACGTPMVSFDVGGVSDLVRPMLTGYLARPEDTMDFMYGIIKILESQELQNNMRQQCREIAVSEYSLKLQAERYINLYDTIVTSNAKKQLES